MADNCIHCNRPYTGKLWCKDCDPIIMVRGWNIENDKIKKLIEESVSSTNHYDSPFFGYIPFDNLDIGEPIGENKTLRHANWNNGLRFIQGINKRREEVFKVAVKEIKNSYNVSSDFISKVIILS